MAKITVKDTSKNIKDSKGKDSKESSNVFQRNITTELKSLKSILTNNIGKTLADINKTLSGLNKNSLNNDQGFKKESKDDLEGVTEESEENKKIKPILDAIQAFHSDVVSILGLKNKDDDKDKDKNKKGGGLFSKLFAFGGSILKKLGGLFSIGGLIKAALIALPLLFYKNIKDLFKGPIEWFEKHLGSKQKKKDAAYNKNSEISKQAIKGDKNFTQTDITNTKYDISKLKEQIDNEKDDKKKDALKEQLRQKEIDLDTQENQLDRRTRFKNQEALGMKSDIYHTKDGKVVDMGAKVGFWRGASTWLKRNFTSANNLSKEEIEKLTQDLRSQGKSDKEIKEIIKEKEEEKTKEWNAQRILGSELANSRETYGSDTEQQKLKSDIDYAKKNAQEIGLNTVNYNSNMSLAYESDAKKEAQLNKQYNRTQDFATETANTEIDLLKQIAYAVSGGKNTSAAPYGMSSASENASRIPPGQIVRPGG